ncbi:DUF3995 domain-containing protein [Fulvivirga sp. 29W222]|uniref:DUF3995 domain-containing protein n=1 Tax=Fulvivirga marina TaxID=2494733 RepID=A0A937G0Q3_9BACT|nr:DUF3995 domain-containing protein [Fulvivirga marina]MBL6448011.1 DUF3995 domain-containing protein [Fulvivirga marina]
MISTLSVINTTILSLLGALHIYWAFGGNWAAKNVLPRTQNGELLFVPRTIDCIVVAAGLLAFASFFMIYSFIPVPSLPKWLITNGLWFIGAIFTIRAIGDFRYVGFMKKIKNNTFASLDTKYYSPLCLYLGLSSFLINVG